VSENELDAQEIVAYRKVLDFARAVVDGKVPPRRAIQAGDALFAALARRDDRQREMLEIVQAVAALGAGGVITTDHVATARQIMMASR
jgi:hypothetical protein